MIKRMITPSDSLCLNTHIYKSIKCQCNTLHTRATVEFIKSILKSDITTP